jgi:uncharacterized protein (TIGR03067 family)
LAAEAGVAFDRVGILRAQSETLGGRGKGIGMRECVIFGLALLLTVGSTGAPRLKDPVLKEPDVTGRWTLVSLSKGGEAVPLGGMAVDTEFTGDGRRVSRNRLGQTVGEVRYVLDREKVPPTLDLRSATDDSITSRGVCKVDGDALTVCYVTAPDAPRPDKFEAPAGSKVYLAVYRRVKAD